MNEKIFPEIPTMPEIPAPEVPGFALPEIPETPPFPEMPDVPAVKLDINYDDLPDHVKTFLELYDQKMRAHIVKLKWVIAAHERHIRELTEE